MKATTTKSMTISTRIKKWMMQVFDKFAELLEDCEWFPCPRQTDTFRRQQNRRFL